jgi:hypothetical protein
VLGRRTLEKTRAARKQRAEDRGDVRLRGLCDATGQMMLYEKLDEELCNIKSHTV